MKTLTIIPILTISLCLNSCAGFFGSGSKEREYQRGVAVGRAQVMRQKYWEEQNKPVETPQLDKHYTPITVPEHTLPDGTLIESHTTYVETVQ
jgi:hypothetical protein